MYGPLSHCCYSWKPGFELPADCPALSRIWAKLHHGCALAMVTLPKRLPRPVLSPWLLVNPPSVVWSQQIYSPSNVFRCRLGVLTTCLLSLLDLVQWVVSFRRPDWSKASSNCAEVLLSTPSLRYQCSHSVFFGFSDITHTVLVKTITPSLLLFRCCSCSLCNLLLDSCFWGSFLKSSGTHKLWILLRVFELKQATPSQNATFRSPKAFSYRVWEYKETFTMMKTPNVDERNSLICWPFSTRSHYQVHVGWNQPQPSKKPLGAVSSPIKLSCSAPRKLRLRQHDPLHTWDLKRVCENQ